MPTCVMCYLAHDVLDWRTVHYLLATSRPDGNRYAPGVASGRRIGSRWNVPCGSQSSDGMKYTALSVDIKPVYRISLELPFTPTHHRGPNLARTRAMGFTSPGRSCQPRVRVWGP